MQTILNRDPVATEPTQDQPDRLLRLKEVEAMTGVKRSTIYKWTSDTTPYRFNGLPFPQKIKYEKSTFWSLHEIQQWIAAVKGVSRG